MLIVVRRLIAFALFLSGVVGSAQSGRSQTSEQPRIEEIRIGFGGAFKVGHWTPVRVVLRGGSQSVQGLLSLELPDGDGAAYRVVWDQNRHLTLPAGAQRAVHLLAKFGRMQFTLKATFQSDNGATVSLAKSVGHLVAGVRSSQQLVITIGDPLGLEDAIRLRMRVPSEAIRSSHVERISDLPTSWQGYSGVDALLLATSNLDSFQRMTGEQLAAMDRWVHLGGRLLLCVGAHGTELLGTEGRLTRFVPGTFSHTVARPPTTQLESLAGMTISNGGGHGSMSVLKEVRGRVEADEGVRGNRRPSLVRGPLGFGQIMFCAVDLDAEPFRSWNGRARLVARLLDMFLGRRDEMQQQRGGEVSHVGYEDLAGQLRVALDQFPGVVRVPFLFVALLVAVYILIIGPGDYFFLRRIRRGMGWTWLTFPLAIVLFVVLAYVLAHHWKGSRLHINQVDLVDVDFSSGWVRGTTWSHIFSPRSETFNLELAPTWPPSSDVATSDVLLAWNGLPGTGFGGMGTPATPVSLAGAYTLAGQATHQGGLRLRLEQFPIPIWSSRALVGQWSSQLAPRNVSRLAAKSDGQLTGSFRNPLPIPLHDCLLMYGDWAYPISRLEPSATMSIEQLQLRSLEYILTRRKVDVEELENVTTPWDPEDVDLARIMEMIMFYQAAGGRSYTRLLHRYRSALDLSDHLTMGRAVLVGQSAQPGATIRRDGQAIDVREPRHRTFFRMLYPVNLP